MTRKEIEEQAALGRRLNAEPWKYCELCGVVLIGLEKLGSVCNHCLSDRAGNRDMPVAAQEVSQWYAPQFFTTYSDLVKTRKQEDVIKTYKQTLANEKPGPAFFSTLVTLYEPDPITVLEAHALSVLLEER